MLAIATFYPASRPTETKLYRRFGVRRIDEPAPAGGVAVEVDDVPGGQAEGRAAEVGDADLQVVQAGGINAGRLPAGEGFGEKGSDRDCYDSVPATCRTIPFVLGPS